MSVPYEGDSTDSTIPGLTGTNSSFNGGIGVSGSGGFGGGTGVFGFTTNDAYGSGVVGSGGTGVVGFSTACCYFDELGNNLGTTGPGGQFAGFQAPSGSGFSGSDGVDCWGGSGDGTGGPGNGISATGADGGTGAAGVGGYFNGGYGSAGSGDGVVGAAGTGFAGFFIGSVNITGILIAAAKYFKIDHPMDPANKDLVHASVESSEMMNIYAGNVTTDGQGQATVRLPEWFETLNTDFRYQLTVVGQFAQAIVARKIENHQFEIKTNVPGVEVSWQVIGVRQDPFAKANPLVVEQEKEARLRGFFTHPELYGEPAEKHIEHARYPHIMERRKTSLARASKLRAKLFPSR